MNQLSIYYFLISIVVTLFLLYMQVRPRKLNVTFSTFFFPVILLIIGLLIINQLPRFQDFTLMIQLFVALFFGSMRAYSVTIYRDKGELYRVGNYKTIGIWIVYMAIEYLIELVANYNFSPIILDIGVSLLIQRLVTIFRTKQYTN
ncbi:hypothetical protein [Acidianus sp. RZ1]|uniref:hypothetical protein n=1 Tax=Acidianus sp. RZ1 TaxID=1540082 RepID=UPI0014913079|nr:hypothetical protein [Acidianus sp. RZ1]NON61560.1 hypothetical protein [Acidianus sp. RZ1]